MGRFARSWQLLKCSLGVMRSHRKLLVFPIIVSMLTGIIALCFLVPLAFWDTGHTFTEAAHWKAFAGYWATWEGGPENFRLRPLAYALLAAVYLGSMFLATFFNVAFYHEILNALNGRAVSVRGGLRFACSRWSAVLLWSLFAGAVGLLIMELERRVNIVGQWVLRLIGIAWSVAAVFVIPAMVREEKKSNPVFFLKSSAGILRKTWGESLIGYAGIQLGGLIFLALSVVFFVAGVAVGMLLGSLAVLIVAGAIWAILLLAFAYLVSIANQVYRGALYIYATEGVVPGSFEREQMDMAWRIEAGRKPRL